MCFVRFRVSACVGGCIVPLRLTNDGFRFLSSTYYYRRRWRGEGTICYANGYCVSVGMASIKVPAPERGEGKSSRAKIIAAASSGRSKPQQRKYGQIYTVASSKFWIYRRTINEPWKPRNNGHNHSRRRRSTFPPLIISMFVIKNTRRTNDCAPRKR